MDERSTFCWLAAVILGLASPTTSAEPTIYNIGVGRADITGPAAEIVFFGYANPGQSGQGIHTCLYSRAFIVDDGTNRVVFVNVDLGAVSQIFRMLVLEKLQSMYGNLYTDSNLCISGTHTHSGPAGYFEYLFYNLPSGGFIEETLDAIVAGIVRSIQLAHESMQPGYLTVNIGNLTNANINRSPLAYLKNPSEERARYNNDTDHQMLLLKMTDKNNNPIGMISWFAVHTTSMNNTNHLISGDNKGIAEILFEQRMDTTSLPGQSKFVAAFASSNLGDVSPNTDGPKCQNTGLPCDAATSTCGGLTGQCYALGPGKDMFESTYIIGRKQYEMAWELFESANTPISGHIKSIHQTIDMSKVKVVINETTNVTTCRPAYGFSLGAGTTDGPAVAIFTQNSLNSNPLLLLAGIVLSVADVEQVACHAPKPILLNVGGILAPLKLVPTIVNTQILQIGNLIIAAVPGEFTTMAGRRMREAMKEVFSADSGTDEVHIAVAGLCNVYSSYITTFEEYQFQRYEGGSTLYGPNTLQAYLQQYKKLGKAIVQNTILEPGPSPPNFLGIQVTLQAPVIYDGAPLSKKFGDVVTDAKASYPKNSTVSVTFVSGNPRNTVKGRNSEWLDGTFLTVERKNGAAWTVIAVDANWETKFIWKRKDLLFGTSEVTVEWTVGQDVQPGTYRIRHFGNSKTPLLGTFVPYNGASREFQVV